jgi:uncharacterized integral membrane protein
MRLLVIVLTILLFIGFLFFVLNNLDTRVQVQVMETVYPEVDLFLVVLLSILTGMLYVGIIAVVEGANVRFVNHRLTKELQQMETEIHYLRTQRVGAPRPEPDAVDEEALAQTGAAGGEVRPDPASAPVYGAEGEWSGDDDDAYSGGRAV